MEASVARFNYIVGNPPKGYEGGREEVWEQIEFQAELILEEAKELLEAAKSRNMVEVLDGYLDVWFTNSYIKELLEACGVDTLTGKDEVVSSNEMKFTTNFGLALSSQDKYKSEGVETLIFSKEYEGQEFHCVKRESDGKVLRLNWHIEPGLEICVPEEWKREND